MPEIIDRDTAKAQGRVRFFTGEPCFRGHLTERRTSNGNCCACIAFNKAKRRAANIEKFRAESREQYHRHKHKNVEKNRARAAQWRAENPERFKEQMREYAQRNSASQVAKAAKWAAKNAEKMREHRKAWKLANPEAVVAADAKRRALEKNAMPKWLTKQHLREIRAVYAESRRLTLATGVPHHVDHIVPLVGKRVCGLHVPWNLQAIPGTDNVRKSNKHD